MKGHPVATTMTVVALWAAPGFTQPMFEDVTAEIAPTLTISRSVAFGDYDNDGWPDVFLSEFHDGAFGTSPLGEQLFLLHNEGTGEFTNHGAEIQSDAPNHNKGGGATFADYDRDGDLDLYVPDGAFRGLVTRGILLRNDQGSMVDVTLAAGLTDSVSTDNAIWFDYDRDGFVDLYHGNMHADGQNYTTTNRMYRNTGDGRFTGDDVGLEGPFGPVGGTNGGMVATDFTSDGQPDVYLGIWNFENRILVNDGVRGFTDGNVPSVADPGEAHGLAVGDINHDGRIDLFQSAGDDQSTSRSLLLLNIGGTDFIDVTTSAGIDGALIAHNPGMADIDNDGDLDLIVATPTLLYLNDGSGLFTDVTAMSGLGLAASAVAYGDYDLDGCLDLVFGSSRSEDYLSDAGNEKSKIYRNTCGTGNHYFRVDLLGTESNRDAIGARLVTVAGDLRQTREIYGGLGYQQDEMVAHFGLAHHTRIDSLIVQWPSGHIDVLADLDVDQTIRLIEGGTHHPAQPSVWVTAPPPTLTTGTSTLSVDVRPALLEPTATITSVVADLSRLGGPSAVSLIDQNDGTFALNHTFAVAATAQRTDIDILVLQTTAIGEHWIRMRRHIEVSDMPTAVLESHDPTLPAEFALSQNHPNPFNPETMIHFDLPTPGETELSLFNLMGQRVATLVSGSRDAGSYMLRWDGRDDTGRELASGVYLFRLIAGDQIETRKLTLLR